MRLLPAVMVAVTICIPAAAQVAPSPETIAAYRGLHAAAAKGDVAAIERAVRDDAALDATDAQQRTPLHVAIFMKQHEAARALAPIPTGSNSGATTSSPSPQSQTTCPASGSRSTAAATRAPSPRSMTAPRLSPPPISVMRRSCAC